MLTVTTIGMKVTIFLIIVASLVMSLADSRIAPLENDKCATLDIISREKWHARPPWRTFPMLLPVNHVIVMHTLNYECNNMYACSSNLQDIQDLHMDQNGSVSDEQEERFHQDILTMEQRYQFRWDPEIMGDNCWFLMRERWWDIAYSFLIGGDGRVYEGVGWKYAAEHTVNYNTISIGVAFMGTFNNVTPSKGMVDACKNLIACGIEKGYLTPIVQISGHRDATCTRSPGDSLYAIIKEWPNFKGGRLPFYSCNSQLAKLRPTED